MSHQQERRRFPRLESELPIKIQDDSYNIITETKNISANGAFCKIRQNIDLMTKLDIVLLVPFIKNTHRLVKKIRCRGVVVRREFDSTNNIYSIGIFFNEIKETDRKKLIAYVNSKLNSRHHPFTSHTSYDNN